MTVTLQLRRDAFFRDLFEALEDMAEADADSALSTFERMLTTLRHSDEGTAVVLSRYNASMSAASEIAKQAGEDIRIAFHESGHALCCHLLGIPFTEITVLAAGGITSSLGHVMPDWSKITRPIRGAYTAKERQDVENFVIMNQAGPVAEGWVNHGRENADVWKVHLDQSRVWAARLRPPMDYACSELFMHWCTERARSLIIQNFPALEILAERLMDKKTLTGEEATAILKAAIAGDPIPGGIEEE